MVRVFVFVNCSQVFFTPLNVAFAESQRLQSIEHVATKSLMTRVEETWLLSCNNLSMVCLKHKAAMELK